MDGRAAGQAIERIIPVARQLLVLAIDDEHHDLWLWERAERVSKLCRLLCELPEIEGQELDGLALEVAGLFHCAGWATQVQQGRVTRWQVLARPTNDIQRELGAALLQEKVAPLLPPKSARTAAEAIRRCNDRQTQLLEAQLLAEAENLDDLSSIYVLRQFRQYQAEQRPLVQLVDSWARQKEYQYWDVRVNEGFRFAATRELARTRLASVDRFMEALARDLGGLDLAAALEPEKRHPE